LLSGNSGVSTEALTQAMERYVADADFYRQQAARVVEVRRKFDIRDCIRRYTEVFEHVIR
jgi:hypothetical protein